MINRRPKPIRGITLIEVLLYTALIAIFITLAIPIFIEMNLWRGREYAFSNTANEYLFLHQYVRGLIENSVQVATPDLNQSSNLLAVTTLSDDEAILGTDSAGKMYLDIENAERVFLTSSTTRADHLYFNRSTVGNLEKIEFSMSLNGIHFGTTSLIIPND